jgi:hypothetical protein
VALSSTTAACVLDAVIRAAFPVDPADRPGGVSATLLIQQFGLVQAWRPKDRVIEDICHAFYAAPDSGARDWAGDYAIVSLPKFFSLPGMAGAIVTRSAAIAARLRERIGTHRRSFRIPMSGASSSSNIVSPRSRSRRCI